jgi:hypothetical protein
MPQIRKLKSSEQIDACVAAVLAHARARVNKKRQPPIHWLW